jgi:predicted SprT family Zn-dependent metalloprotease
VSVKLALKTGEEEMNKTATIKKTGAEDIFQAPAKSENLSIILTALESAHSLIQEKTGTPRATISIGRSDKVHGHFTPWTPWQNADEQFHEIFLSASSFSRGARATLGTLLHEMAHSLDTKEGRKGTSGDGYHNKTFKKTAEEVFGLKIEQVKGKGWTDTQVPDSCVEMWKEAHDLIEEALKLTASNDLSIKPKGRNKNNKVAVCNCGEKIRLSLKTYNLTRPTCTNCDSSFILEDEEDGE